jgi:hypothetical protein
MFRLCARVLGLLGPQMKLGWVLALANVALAAAGLAEPVLFGRIIDALASAQGSGGAPDWPRLTPLVAAWAGFALFPPKASSDLPAKGEVLLFPTYPRLSA